MPVYSSSLADYRWIARLRKYRFKEKKPSYYDSPADKDLLKKSVILGRSALATSAYIGLCDAFLIREYTQVRREGHVVLQGSSPTDRADT